MRFGITVPLLLFFLVARRWRVIAGSALVGSLLVVASFVIVGRSFIAQYVGMCQFLAAAHNAPEAARMPTVRGFLTATFPHQPHLAVAVIALSILILIWGLRIWIPWNGDPAALDRLFALALVISLVIDYHGFIYNMTSLVLPGLLLLQRHPKASIILWICAAATFWITFAGRGHGEFGLLAPLFLVIAISISRRNPSELIAEQTI
jgi:hypothetical protein